MENIAAGLCDDVYIGANIATIAGVISRGLDFEFLKCIRIGNRDASSARTYSFSEISDSRETVNRNAIHLIVIRIRAGAIGGDVLGAFRACGRVCHVGIGPGGETQQVDVISCSERKVRHGSCRNHCAQRRIRCLNGFGRGLYCNFLLDRCGNVQAAVQYGSFGDVYGDGRNFHRLETRRLKLDAVGARRQQVESVRSVLIGGCSSSLVRIGVRGRDGCTSNNGSLSIRHGSSKRSRCGGLPKQSRNPDCQK